jgi:hypothetical protein
MLTLTTVAPDGVTVTPVGIVGAETWICAEPAVKGPVPFTVKLPAPLLSDPETVTPLAGLFTLALAVIPLQVPEHETGIVALDVAVVVSEPVAGPMVSVAVFGGGAPPQVNV